MTNFSNDGNFTLRDLLSLDFDLQYPTLERLEIKYSKRGVFIEIGKMLAFLVGMFIMIALTGGPWTAYVVFSVFVVAVIKLNILNRYEPQPYIILSKQQIVVNSRVYRWDEIKGVYIKYDNFREREPFLVLVLNDGTIHQFAFLAEILDRKEEEIFYYISDFSKTSTIE